MTKALKHTILGLLAALLAISAACLLTKPAEQAKADEAYSETWVIKEDWTWTKNISSTIRGRVAADSCTSPDQTLNFSFDTFSVTGSGVADCRIKLNNQEISIHTSNGSPYFGYPCKMMSSSYDSWVVGSGTIIFFQDTSATEYSELRTWLNANAEETETKEYVESLQYGDAVPLVAESDNENERNYELPLDTWMLICNTDFKVRLLVNGEQIVSIGSPTEDWTNTEGVSYFLKRMDLGYLKFDSKKINSVYLKRYLPKETGSGVVLIDESCNYLKISIPVTYTITFKDGANELKSTIVNENAKADTIDLTDINTAKTGYTFKGWSKTDGGAVVNLANETITADTTYYAVYEINKYSVIFYYGTSVLKTVTVPYGTKANEIDVSNLAPGREGYTFKGWARTNGGEVVDLSAITITQSMALFASYKKQTFEVKFYDGETLLKTATVDYGTNLSAISLTGVTTDKAGFTFRGWALSNGGAAVNFETYSVKSAVNLYAVYDVDGKATVVFKDGATSLKTVTVDLGVKASEIDISDLELEKSGYTFKGWARSENGIIVDLETVSVNEYTVLYAVYEKNANNVLDDVSSWLTTKTGIAFSATGVLVLALGVYLLLRRK